MQWRQRVALSSWGLALWFGVTFGAWMVGLSFLHHEGWGGAGAGVVSGVMFGLVMGPLTARHNRRVLVSLDGVPPKAARAVLRDARRGRLAGDSPERAAALRLARCQHDQMITQRRWAIPALLLLFVALGVAAVFLHRPAGLLMLALPIILLGVHVLSLRRLRRQIAVLQQPGS